MMWTWASATIKRVVRSTLAAEAYAISEAAEFGHLLRQLLQQVHHPELTLKQLEAAAPTGALLVVTDSQNLATNVPKDTSAVTDKRLRIVITMLRETFLDPQQRTQLLWKPTGLMLADGLTKAVKADALLAAVQSNNNNTTNNNTNNNTHNTLMVTSEHIEQTADGVDDVSFLAGVIVGFVGCVGVEFVGRRVLLRLFASCLRCVRRVASASVVASSRRGVLFRTVAMQTDSSVSATSANLRNRYGFGAVSVSAPHRRADIAVPVVRVL
ncbi:unnamed protein product [Polarella glacialis]|uniref:Uncharacterized protein n=1 Tax=Polarella glacialis TaxID=89957 RepID=A0A813HFK7_POLGL|nr:unnamed protein product [Polarella glacialis]